MALKKVVHLSTGHLGGAGIAARNLNSGLNEIRIESFFVATGQVSYELENGEIAIQRGLVKKMIGRSNSIANKHVSSKSVFTLSSSSSNFEALLQIVGNPDETIVHIHNWFNLVSLSEVERFLEEGFKVVFTLHDERILTGGCHSTLSCNLYKSGCNKCPEVAAYLERFVRKNHQNQMALLKKYNSQITFIAPSNWISNQAFPISEELGIDLVVINNYIPAPIKEGEFPIPNPKNSMVLGVANVDPKSYIKGGDRLDLVKLLTEQNNLQITFMDLRDFSEGSLRKEQFWKSIDFLLITSRSENSPNIIFEAKGYGVPVIATDVGGIRELLNLDFDFFLDFSSAEHVLETLRCLKLRSRNSSESNLATQWARSKAIQSLRKHAALYAMLSG